MRASGVGEDAERVGRPPLATRIAALSFMLDAGFGVAMPVTLSHLNRHGGLPTTSWGFTAFDGPFAQLGQEPFVALGSALVAVLTTWEWSGREVLDRH